MHPGFGPEIGIHEGDLIGDKYRVERVLGVGGMGVVVAAQHLGLYELVAIKLLLPEALADGDAMHRFEREARAAVKIKSEHVARIIDVGMLESGTPFIVMEYLRGEDLADRIARTGPLAVDDAIELLLQACEAIAEAHALGIVHRDLKPANLFCVQGADGHTFIKVLDFGISKLTHGAAEGRGLGMTKTRAVMGSPYYMSPEQMESPRKVDARTDIWSLGVVFHEMLTGEVPFGGETLPQVCVNVATRPAPPLRKTRPDVASGLEAIALRCLEKDPEKRYPTVAALVTALAKFGPKRAQLSVDRVARTHRQTEAQHRDRTGPHHPGASDRPVTGPLPSWSGTAKSMRGRRRSFVGWMAVALVVSGGFTFALLESSTRTTASAVLIAPPQRIEPNESAPKPPALSPREAPSPAAATPVATTVPLAAAQTAPSPRPAGGEANVFAPRSKLRPPSPPPAEAPRPAPAVAANETNPYATAPESPNAAGPASTCTLHLNSIPASRVVLDGKPLGFTPKSAVTVPGDHHVVFIGLDKREKQISVSCEKGESKTISQQLDEPPPTYDSFERNPYR
jgi:serine/threonine-protein kinase